MNTDYRKMKGTSKIRCGLAIMMTFMLFFSVWAWDMPVAMAEEPVSTEEATSEPTAEPTPEPTLEPTPTPETTPEQTPVFETTPTPTPEPLPESMPQSEGMTVPMDFESFAQGDGSESDPYGISTPEQLNAVRDFPDAHFILLNDIDMSEATSEGGAYYNSGLGFTPIPDYNGTFNGNGHKIIGLNINRPREENIGLFASILSNATISKLGVIDSNIYGGHDHTGSICGISQGLIEYCYNTGNVTGRYYGVTGGIVGGGGRTECCYNTGYIRMIEMPGTGSGGISLIGGISGGTIAVNCYNAGAVEGYGDCGAGGIIGSGNTATSNCYNAGPVKGYPAFGTINYDIGETKLNGIYYLKVNDFVLGVGDDAYHEGFDYASQLTNEQMKDQNSFDTFDFEDVWTMAGDPSYPYPELRNVSMVPMPENTTDFAGGNGLPYSPYEISSPEQLDNIRKYMHGYFCLINDLLI